MAMLRHGMFASVDYRREFCKGCRHYGQCDYVTWASPDCARIEMIIDYINKTLES